MRTSYAVVSRKLARAMRVDPELAGAVERVCAAAIAHMEREPLPKKSAPEPLPIGEGTFWIFLKTPGKLAKVEQVQRGRITYRTFNPDLNWWKLPRTFLRDLRPATPDEIDAFLGRRG